MKFLLLALLLAAGRPAAAPSYSITDLGDVHGSSLEPAAINARGQLSGSFRDPNGHMGSFLYDGGRLSEIDSPVGPYRAMAGGGLSSNGQSTGNFSLDPDGRLYHAYLYSGGRVRDLGTLPGDAHSFGLGINDSGEVVGCASSSASDTADFESLDYQPRAFLYKAGKMTPLGALGGKWSRATAINGQGEITGDAETRRGEGHEHAFLYRNGRMRDLGALRGHDWSSGSAINGRAQVTGQAQAGAHSLHAFLYSQGRMRDLGTLPGYHNSQGTGINSGGQVVGSAVRADGRASHAFLYSGGRMTDLNALIPAGTGWVLETAADINDQGRIIGQGQYKGERRFFLLVPKSKMEVTRNMHGNQ